MAKPNPAHPLAWLPNALTIGRILSLPLLFWLIAGKSVATPEGVALLKWATGLFILCGITDFLDGYFARKWKVVSDFGRMLDPIADKLLVATCLIAINLSAATSHGILWVVLIPSMIIIGRDILVSGVREHAANSQIVLSPTKLAKWKTAFEMLAIFLFLLAMANMSGNAPTNDGTGQLFGNGRRRHIMDCGDIVSLYWVSLFPWCFEELNRNLPMHGGVIIRHKRFTHLTRYIFMLSDFTNRSHFGGGPHDKTLGEMRELCGVDITLIDFNAALFRKLNHAVMGDAVQ